MLSVCCYMQHEYIHLRVFVRVCVQEHVCVHLRACTGAYKHYI